MKPRFKIWQAVVILIIVGLLACACGPASKLRRAERLIAKAEEAGLKWSVDTVTIKIPVPVPQIRVDTVLQIKDGVPVVVEKERLRIEIRRIKGDTIMIMAECLADTIYQKVPVTIVKTIKAESWLKWWYLPLCFLAGIMFWIGYLQVKKARN